MGSNTEKVIYSKYYMRGDTLEITEIDDQFTSMLGYTMEDIREHHYTLFDLIPPEDLEEYQMQLAVQHNVDKRAYLWHRMVCKDGTIVYVFCFGEDSVDSETGEDKVSCLITDTTSIRNLRNEVSEKSALLEGLLDNMAGGAGIFEVRYEDGDGKIKCTYASRNLIEDYDFAFLCEGTASLEQFYSTCVLQTDVNRSEAREKVLKGEDYTLECRIRHKNGGYTWTNVIICPMKTTDNIITCMVLMLDISKRKETELSMQFQNELLKLCVEEEKEKIFDYNLEKDMLTVSTMIDGELKEIAHIEACESQCEKRQWIHPSDKAKAVKVFHHVRKERDNFNVDIRICGDGGKYTWYRCYGVSLENGEGRVCRIVGKARDITEEAMRNRELKQQAERDALTGVYNQTAMMKYVYANVGKEFTGKCAFFILDVDDFKLVNDMWGHETGDKILAQLGRTLRTYVAGRGITGRIGGDEFMIFLYRVSGRQDVERHMAAMRDKMEELPERISLTLAIGAGIAPRMNVDVQGIYKEAAQALYEAKRRGGNTAIIYDKSEMAVMQKDRAEKGVYVAEEDLILNETTDGVYVTDLDDYSLLYLNDVIYRDIKSRKGEFDYKGKKCYEVLCDRAVPCELCNAKALKKHESLYWQRFNELNQCQYVCKDTLIDWEGKRARMEVAYNVSTPADMLHVMEKCLGSNDTLKQCVSQLSDTSMFNNSYHKFLRFVGKYYGAERTCIIEAYERDHIIIHKWKNEHATSKELEQEQGKLSEAFEFFLEHANKKGLVILDNIVQYREKEEELYGKLIRDRTWMLYGTLLKKEDEPIGCLVVVNPKQHVGDMLLLTTLSSFLSSEIIRKKMWEKQEYELSHDPHTGALNRTIYIKRTAELQDAKSVGLASVDINSMRRINNDFGVEHGNKIVIEISDILREAFGDENVYRFQSDEFMILCVDEERDEFVSHVEQARRRLANHEVGASIGYVWDDFEMDIRKMTDHAEELLKIEKLKFHESNADDPKYRQQEIVADLKNKIASGYFHVYLQPKIRMDNESYYGAEALIRAVDPEAGIISPARFIPVLEKTGTIEHIDFFVFEEVCRLVKKWQAEGIPLIPISFNFSRLTLLGTNLIDRVEEIVSAYQVPKSALEIEITESIGDLEYDMIARIAHGLREAGYRLSMDDFGTKYSSISTLSIMKFDILKIDRSMVNTLEQNEISRKIMNHVIAMCQDLGIECIAEGVETEEQANLLQTMECTIAQGYLYGKPMPVEEFSQKYKASLQMG